MIKRKKMLTSVATASLTVIMAMNVYAVGWQHNTTGWWYGTNETNTTWHANGWQWIDGNNDGIAECYYFDQNGYMLASTTTPDGFTVNTDGAWTVNGVVQTKSVDAQNTVTASDTYSTSEYDNNGISLAALDMLGRTRAENAKYGEERVVENGTNVSVVYNNGLVISYDFDGGYNGVDTEIRTGWSDVRNIFKYADLGTDDEDLVRILKKKGYDCYTNDNVHVMNLKSNVTTKTYTLYVYGFSSGHRAIVFGEQTGVY